MFLWVLGALAAEYQVVDLGTLGGRSAAAAAVNERGQVVGIAGTDGAGQRAFLWENGEMRDLGTLGGRHSFAWDINDRGVAVGGAQNAEGQTRAVKWEGGQIVELAPLPGGDASFALAINESGLVAGFSATAGGDTHAVVWDDGRPIDLGTLGGGLSYALDVNASGQVLAMSTTEQGHRAFLWRDGQRVEVGPPAAIWTSALDLNDKGQVVGSTPKLEEMKLVGYRWSPDGTVETFGFGGDVVVVAAINESGVAAGYGTLPGATPAGIEASRREGALPDLRGTLPVGGAGVGGAESAAGAARPVSGPGGPGTASPAVEPAFDEEALPVPVHAFVYRDGAVVDLGTLGGLHASAVDINARGHVVGASARADGTPRAFVWDGAMTELPTPPDASSGASDINDAGLVVGSWSQGGARRAFLAVRCEPGRPCEAPSRPPSTN